MGGLSIIGTALLNAILIIFTPWRVTARPIEHFLRMGARTPASRQEKRTTEKLTPSWAEKKLAEHTFVGITVWLPRGHVSMLLFIFLKNTCKKRVNLCSLVCPSCWWCQCSFLLGESRQWFALGHQRTLVREPVDGHGVYLPCNSAVIGTQPPSLLFRLWS